MDFVCYHQVQGPLQNIAFNTAFLKDSANLHSSPSTGVMNRKQKLVEIPNKPIGYNVPSDVCQQQPYVIIKKVLESEKKKFHAF